MVPEPGPIPALSVVNRHPSFLPGPSLLHELVPSSSSCAEFAIDFLQDGSRRRLSYESLHALSDTLAATIVQTLARLDRAPAVIPIFLPQCPELYIAILAILKAGKAFCPLNLDTPDQRLDFILEDLSAELVVTDSAHASTTFQRRRIHALSVDQELHAPVHDFAALPSRVDTNDLAYVLYTSGSTGLPKAVGVSHRSVTQSLLAHHRHIPEFDRFLQFAAPTFDVSIFEIFFPLFRGKTMVGCSRHHMLDHLPSTIRDLQVDAAELTPTVVSNLLNGRKSVPGLKLLLTIGEMLTSHIINEFGGSPSRPSILWGMYGPTEAAIHCTLQPNFQSDSPIGNIGYPLDTVSAFVMEPVPEGTPPANMRILPIGEVGELVIGGHQIAEEYLNRPELTSLAFIQHPEFGILYRTLDKARLLPNGTLECLGRMDSSQVKLRGQRIELGEIENVISKVDGCHTTVALVIKDDLIVFCAVGSATITKTAIMDSCKRWLPSYMVPTDVLFLPHMPQVPSGKVDKRALEIQYLHGKQSKEPTAPLSGSSIQGILTQVLDRHIPLGIPLVSLGLDSLRSIRIASMLRKDGYLVGALDVLTATNLEELVSICEAKHIQKETDASSIFSALKEAAFSTSCLKHCQNAVANVIPCTPLQEAMLAETMIRPEAYCNWIEIEIDRPATYEEIRAHLEELAMHNEILRSGFFATYASSKSSFAQVTWKQLDKSQIAEVTTFSRKYTLGSEEAILRPLNIQVNAALPKPRMLFQIHHALYDGWSVDLLLHDLHDLLDKKSLDARAQYSEVVKYFSHTLCEEELRASASYWAEVLQGYSQVQLPNLNGRVVHDSTLRSMSGKSAVNFHTLMGRAEESSISPQVFFQAAVAYMVGSITGSTDVVIGTVTSGRTIPVNGIESILGPCIASLPLRLDISSCSSIIDMLQSIQKSNREMLQHCTLPLREIAKLCGLHPGMHLFDVLFVWQQSLFSSNDESTVKIIDQADELEYKLTLEFEPSKDSILWRATYDSAFVPEAQVNRLLHQIDEIVEYTLQNANLEVETIGLCFSPQNLSIANPSPVLDPISHGPAYAVERWALQAPDEDALILGAIVEGTMTETDRLTYSTLNARANQLAHALMEHGVGEDELICVLMEKSINLYISILAVAKLGCGYLPIVPDSPLDRTQRILSDANVRICISESTVSSLLQDGGPYKVFNLDIMDFSHQPSHNLDVEYNGSHLAYAVFTSGSTGTPKGVLVTQDNLMSNLEFLHGLYPTSQHSRLLQACSQAFDVSVFEIFFTWYAGMCLCTATKDDLYSNFEHSIDLLGITHLSLTPTVASLVNPSNVPKVTFLVTAGEALTEHVRRQWAGKGLYQGYGPSETTNICTIRAPVTNDDSINNIGPPFANTSAFVLEPDSERILPQGAIGELCFGGAQVFRGYLNNPELNAQKIINHFQYGRMYRSGDMGMLLSDDSILFTGRSDDQVKIRGQRAELGEITSIILDHIKIEDCVTLLVQMDGQNQRLVVFWVPVIASKGVFKTLAADELTSLVAIIFETLALSLPSYMVPTHLVPIACIPLTAQSKVDKRLLLSTYKSLSNEFLQSVAYNTPTTGESKIFSEQESIMAAALAETTGVPLIEISRISSFFSLGLDSISAIQFSRRLRDAGNGEIPVSVILKNATIARLSANCTPSSSPIAFSQSSQIQVSDIIPSTLRSQLKSEFRTRSMEVQKILPCTPLQEAMLSKTSGATDLAYCNTMIFTVTGSFDRLQESWSQMFSRHEILRTSFVSTDHPKFAFVQVILPYKELEWHELRKDQDVNTFALESLSALLQASEPPVRLAFCHNGGSTKLIFSCHHALYDGVAISTLLREVEQAYLGKDLPPPIPYERYLQHMVSQDTNAADEFWRTSLANLEPTIFPSLSGVVPNDTMPSSSFTRKLEMPLSDVSRFCQESSTSLLSVVQAAWAKILHFYSGEEDLCFGNVVSGRTLPEPDLDRLVGPCFNTLPVRLNFDFRKSNAEMVRQLHEFNIDSLPYQLTPLRRIHSHIQRTGGPLFDTLVILQQPSTPLNHSIWSLDEDAGAMDLPVVCEVYQDREDDTLRLTLHFHTSLLSDHDAKLMSITFDHALQSLVKSPRAAAVDTIGFPTEILAAFNLRFTTFNPSEGPLLHSAFEKNAELHPEFIALDFQHDDGSKTVWTFGELNAVANQIAFALIELGVKPEDIIPILVPKSPHFYASILGVLKSGAAFTPISPDLPKARKQFMLAELQPKVLLCNQFSSSDWCGNVPVLDIVTTEAHSKANLSVHGLARTNLAYCLYTSGSTGVPKAVSMDHRSPIQTIESSRSLIPWKHGSRLLQYAAVSFDMCYYDCFLAWSFGFTLCAADQDAMLNDISSIIRSLDVDLLDLTPSVAATLTRGEVPCVRWLYCIGEAMSPKVVREWEGACVNSYGPTEAAFCTSIFSTQKDKSTNIIGKPFPTTSYAVFPKSGSRILPTFGVGELYIGGAQLARGYYQKPELNEERFVIRDGQRFYKSGDMVRMLGNGDFEFIGRADDQVKIRGLRVELGEISHVVQGCDERICSITTQILRKDIDAKHQLVTFLVTSRPANLAEQLEVRKKANQAAVVSLPAYMVPRFYIFLDEIPKSSAGKVDKNSLAELFRNSESSSSTPNEDLNATHEHEWTKTETVIRNILAALSTTHIDDIYPTTSIYQLGLDSISAVQVASGLRKKSLDATVTDVLKYMNCVDLAAHIDGSSSRVKAADPVFDFDSFEEQIKLEALKTCGKNVEEIESIRPCTPLQSGMIAQFIATDGAVYLNRLRLRIGQGVLLPRLKEAWRTTMETHKMLRTGFVHVKHPKYTFAMIHYAASACSLPWDEKAKTNNDHDQGLLSRPEQGASESLHQPPWLIRAVNIDDEVFLDLEIFHALYDAQSLRAIFNNVSRAYHQIPIDIPTPIDPALGNIIHLSTDEDGERNHFWQKLGKNLTPSRFPNLAPLRFDPAPPVVVSRICATPLSELEFGCRTSNITLQAAGIASWASILSAYTGESSVTCGVVLSGRNHHTAEAVAFPCITTVPFVCMVDEDKERMLSDIMMLNADIQQHQFTPLNDIQRLMGYPNESLFDTIFTFQKISNDKEQVDIWTVVDEKATVEYPVSIELEPKDGQLELRLTFLPNIIPGPQAALILDQLDHLINKFIFSKTTSVADERYEGSLYSITPPAEPILPSQVTLLHGFVETSALNMPDCIALEFATSIDNGKRTSKTWTYAELDSEGNKIANLLLAGGVQPGGLVGVCFEKCPEASFAILGILKAGCAFVALDPGAPVARQAFILEDSGAGIVLSMRAQTSGFPGTLNARILNLDEIDLRSLSAEKPSLQRLIDPQDRSYCLYTSGTTGTPKGCELTHENAVQAMLAFQRLFAGHWDKNSRWLQFASFHFDVSVLEQYWSWSVGICVISAPRDLLFEDLPKAIRVLDVTHIDLTPSLARILHPDDVPSLCKGVFITGGESLKQEILDVWGPKGVIYNGYGPTEATIGVTMYPRVPANGKPSNIGPQFDNVGSFVLRPGSDTPVLRGGVGELCVSGMLVGKGYLKRPELTEQRFPHLARFDERVYCTGDLVRILHDGSFDFLGRADDQVKLRGQRLEIGEINSVIKQSGPGISDVATLVLRHPKQQKDQLVSFVVTSSKSNSEPKIILETTNDIEKAKEACQENLPGYMIPTHFVALSAMPLSANNKAENKKLKEMYSALPVADLQFLSGLAHRKEEKWSTDEQMIRTILQEMLKVSADDIKKGSSLFELGLDSISVIGFSRTLKQAGFKNATVSTIMKNTSINRLSKALAETSSTFNDHGAVIAAQQAITAIQHRHRRAVAESFSIDAREIETLAPCTPLQQGMIARYLNSDQGLYFNAFYFTLGEDVDVEKLKSAWEEAFVSIQILRTVFSNTEDGFVQAVFQNPLFPWRFSGISNDELLGDRLKQLKREWWDLNRTMLKKPFELHLVTSPKRRVLAVHIFHALYDGISIGLLFKMVWNTFNNEEEKDVGAPFQSVLAHGPLRSSKDAQIFWTKHISDYAFRPLPMYTKGSHQPVVVINRELRDLSGYESLRRKLNVTPQAVAQACWATVLHSYIKGAITLGMVVSGRSIDFEGADSIIGPMFNTLPYQHRLEAQESWASIIKKTHDFNIAAHPYQHTPLRDIIKWAKINPGQPLFDNLFVYQVKGEDEVWAKNRAWELQDVDADADYPLAFEIEQNTDESLKITLISQGNVLDENSANQLLDEFERSLRTAVRDSNMVVESSSADWAEPPDIPEREPVTSVMDGANGFEWTPTAQKIKEEITTLAGVEGVDVNEITSIFELGLDSIDAIKLSSKLKKHGIDLPVSAIMQSLTISNMVTRISSHKEKSSQQPPDMVFKSHKRMLENFMKRGGMPADDIEQILPLTPLQEGMVAEMIASDYMRYYNHDVLKLAPDVDHNNLQDAWNQVVRSSPILRTSFIVVDDPDIEFAFAQVTHRHEHDLFGQKITDGEPDFPSIFEQIRQDAVNATCRVPLFRIHVIHSPGQDYLVLSIAHALYDGWSLGLLHSDVQDAYKGQFKPRPSYEFALRDILTASGSDAAEFWRDYLSDAKSSLFKRETAINVDLIERVEQTSNTNLVDLTLFAKKNNITLQALGQTVYAMVLGSHLRSLDVTFGCVLSGRDNDDLSEVLFPVMNTVAIRTILHSTRRDLLQYVQGNLVNIKQWQHFPLRKAQALIGAQGPLFDSLFIYQRGARVDDDNRPRLYESVEGRSDVEYPLCVEMEVSNGNFIWRCALKEGVLGNRSAKDFLDTLDSVLRAVVQQPDVPTIEFTAAGTSICGLPAFHHDHTANAEVLSAASEIPPPILDSVLVKPIREVLALVSKTPEDQIGEGMTIFHMGLDSISAIKVSALLRKRSIILSASEMIKAGTIENMAKVINTRKSIADGYIRDPRSVLESALESVDQAVLLHEAGLMEADIENIMPTTAGQSYALSMWLNSKGCLFYPEFSYRIDGPISLDRLQDSWQNLVTANPILRTCLLATKDNHIPYIQAILSKSKASIVDTTGMDEQTVTKTMEEHTSKQPYVHPFVSKSPQGWNLRLKIHHALYDGVSLPLLMQQFHDMYSNSIHPPPSSNSTSKFIAAGASKYALEKRKTFWTNYLSNVQLNRLTQPTSPPNSRTEVFRCTLLKDMKPFDALARKNGLSIHSLFFAIYAKLYAGLTWTGADQDIVIGLYLANRSHAIIQDLSSSTFPTVNMVPLRVATPLKTDMLAMARHIQNDIQDISNSAFSPHVSLFEIEEWTGVKMDTFVNFLSTPDTRGERSAVGPNEETVTMHQTALWEGDVSRIAEDELPAPGFVAARQAALASRSEIGVLTSYLHSVDVEATMRNGALDVGLFAPNEMMSVRDAEMVVEQVRAEFERLIEGRGG